MAGYQQMFIGQDTHRLCRAIEYRVGRPIPSLLRRRPEFISSEILPLFRRILRIHALTAQTRIFPEHIFPAHEGISHDTSDLWDEDQFYLVIGYAIGSLPAMIVHASYRHVTPSDTW